MSSNENHDSDSEVNCEFCNGFYGLTSGGPICNVCHIFIFEYNCQPSAKNFMKDKDTSDDSGNEDGEDKNAGGANELQNHLNSGIQYNFIGGDDVAPISCGGNRYRATSRIDFITNANSTTNYFQFLPTEILLKVFSHLDDISLWSLRFTTNRFRKIIDDSVDDEEWKKFVEYRWPIHRNKVPNVCYRKLYSNLMQSMTCRTCLERLRDPPEASNSGNGSVLCTSSASDSNSSNGKSGNNSSSSKWFTQRLKMESDILRREESYGVRAVCLDTPSRPPQSTWMASIQGPPGSSYEGGLFLLLVYIPADYPLQPPRLQFLTRVCHPNISKHGDIGMDLLQCNWSLALTLSKLLISVQSLLTDPNSTICMEPEIGEMYSGRPEEFRQLSRTWTWKYAMHDYLPPDLVKNISI